jgi:hypothetical protein
MHRRRSIDLEVLFLLQRHLHYQQLRQRHLLQPKKARSLLHQMV